jgi:hypothetical protein
MNGFRSVTHEARASEGDTATIDLTLAELTGSVLINTEPAGARVVFDDGTIMKSPARRPHLSATQPHRAEVSLEGYETASLDLPVRADTTVQVLHVFSRRTAPLVISSTPAGATVTMDGKEIGATPLPIIKAGYGTHEIMVTLAGYDPWSGKVDIPVANDRLDLTLSRQRGGTIEVRVTPWANLYVDGKLIAETVTNRKVGVDVGTHVVELRNPTFATFTQQVEVNSGDTKVVDHRFSE